VIIDITPETQHQIKNPRFAAYAAIYERIYDDFMKQVQATGIEICAEDDSQAVAARINALRHSGAIFRNADRSIYINAISPACVACQTGIGSATFFISLQCHRDCYYCFNPNQVEYNHFNHQQRDLVRELEEIQAAGMKINHLALTGGEPLLHKDEAVDFLRYASDNFPDTFKRLYTTGDHANEAMLRRLRDAGLEEIRFSIRMHDLAKGHRLTLERIALAREYIPTVMVEMPILPGTQAVMEAVLLELERLQIHSINLLEFCYPFNRAQVFRQKGFQVKKRPYKILYNYWYAGGVPIAGSEQACLDLLAFALDQGLTIGVHYCSLENKLTGQNYQQNAHQPIPKTAYFSEKDYLLKSAKVFGRDVPKALNALHRNGYRHYQRNREHRYLEFHVSQIETLADLDVEVGISSSVQETRQGDQYLRELKVDLTTPQLFDLAHDV